MASGAAVLGSTAAAASSQVSLKVPPMTCFSVDQIVLNGVWRNGLSFSSYAVPMFFMHILCFVVPARLLAFLIKPLRQPKVVAEILVGILLGQSGLGRIPQYDKFMLPKQDYMVLDTVSNLAMIYFIFLVGVKLDMRSMKGLGKKVAVAATASIVLPFVTTLLAAYFIGLRPVPIVANQLTSVMSTKDLEDVPRGTFLVFLAATLTVTAFPVLARLIADFKILSNDTGRLAVLTSIANVLISWVLMAVGLAVTNPRKGWRVGAYVLLSSAAFFLLCLLVVRPAMSWALRRLPETERISNGVIGIILVGTAAAGLLTEMIGIHAMTGAFLFGLMVPTGPVAAALVDRTEEFLVNLLLPIFYIHGGLRFNLPALWRPNPPPSQWPAGWTPLPHEGFYLVVIIALASACKVLSGLLVSFFFSTPVSEGITLGFLLCIKGPVEIMILGIAFEKMIFSPKLYNIILLGVLVVTMIASPSALLTHRPPRRHVAYKRRNLQRSKPDGELRMVACVHTNRNVPSIINLLEVSNPTKRSPIFVYALHLVELSGRASAMLIVHNPIQTKPGRHHRKGGGGGGTSRRGGQQQSEQIITAFENYEQHAGGVSVQPLTAVSPYSSMHDDICSIAEERHAALIVLPFHKAHTVGGDLETINPGIRSVNQNVLANAPCSVAILVDRGLGAGAAKFPGSRLVAHNVALLFFGGPDDREALAYAWRMAEHPGITLTVVRFLPGAAAAAASAAQSGSSLSQTCASDPSAPMTVVAEEDLERRLDDEYVNEFRLRNVGAETVVYAEKVVSNSEETVEAIRSMETIHDLYVVGRGHGKETPLTAGLAEWSEFPELGSIGDLLASSDFGATVSVLVVQQYVMPGFGCGGAEQPAAPESPKQAVLQYLSKANHRPSRPTALSAGWNGAGFRY